MRSIVENVCVRVCTGLSVAEALAEQAEASWARVMANVRRFYQLFYDNAKVCKGYMIGASHSGTEVGRDTAEELGRPSSRL